MWFSYVRIIYISFISVHNMHVCMFVNTYVWSVLTAGWGDGVVGKMGGGMMGGGGGDWGEDTTGTMSAGWPGAGDSRGRAVGRGGTPGTPGSQWIPPKQDGWGKKVCCLCTICTSSCTTCLH